MERGIKREERRKKNGLSKKNKLGLDTLEMPKANVGGLSKKRGKNGKSAYSNVSHEEISYYKEIREEVR